MDRDKIIYLIKIIADSRNWGISKEESWYGDTYTTLWLGDEDIESMVKELLEELEGEDNGN